MAEMMHRDEGWPSVDFTDPEVWCSPASAVQHHFDLGHRILWAEGLQAPMLIRHGDIRDALARPSVGPLGIGMLDLVGWNSGAFVDAFRDWLVTLDEPQHGRLRRLVSWAFTPRRMAAMEQITREAAEHLADEMAQAVDVDLSESFAAPLALAVLCNALGVPTADHVALATWVKPMAAAMGTPTMEQRAAADEAMLAFTDYVVTLIEERRRHPGADLLTSLIDAEEQGDRLTNNELVGTVANLLFGGQETTRDLIGSAVFTLLSHPDELARLRAEPTLVGSAIEEVLRYEPPASHIVRPARGDLTIAGAHIPDGQYVVMNVAAANRDPSVFPQPTVFDIQRRDNHHLTFSFGAHFCLGAYIARLEARVALETLLHHFTRIELTGTPRWTPFTSLRTLDAVPIRVQTGTS
jgi:cytochrome P450